MTELYRMQCGVCGIVYAIPMKMAEHAQTYGGYHHCPNGHSWGWAKDGGRYEQARRRAERAEQEKARLHDEIEAEKRRTAAAKAQLTKHKKRSSAGTCPCCKRTFANMTEHMKRQHPEYVAEHGAKVVPIKQTA